MTNKDIDRVMWVAVGLVSLLLIYLTFTAYQSTVSIDKIVTTAEQPAPCPPAKDAP